jgi:uncharacterized protein (TIGR02646 family)
MIRVDRASVPVPAVFSVAGGKVEKERTANDQLALQQKFKEMKFAAYKDPSIMDALRVLFNGKCAYCESRYVAQQPGDVEHFRPKGEVAVKGADGKLITKTGYYWLAAQWDNLLPSCADCNRPRKHEIRSGAGKRVLGKANWFPVDPEAKRATQATSVAAEPRLLLDPCLDDPNAHLVFDEDGTVNAKVVGAGLSKTGEATIEFCALARLELTQERNKWRKLVVDEAIDNVKEAIAAGDSAAVTQRARHLAGLIERDAPYSAYVSRLLDLKLGPLRTQLGL